MCLLLEHKLVSKDDVWRPKRPTSRLEFEIKLSVNMIRGLGLLSSVLILLEVRYINAYSVRVCQNKHCCKRTRADILQTMSNLVVVGGGGSNQNTVSSSGCLSNCDIGPNVQLELEDGTSILVNGMVDAQTCADQLIGAIDSSSSIETALAGGKLLVAASKVMEQSQQLADSNDRIRYLSSVIDKLEGPSSALFLSAANAHAHTLRAQQHWERQDYDAAILDARLVVEGPLSKVATLNSRYLAYRSWADAERSMAEESATSQRSSSTTKKDFSRVVAILQQWRKEQPMYQTKLQREIQDLLAEGA
jgi:hypothetical protein